MLDRNRRQVRVLHLPFYPTDKRQKHTIRAQSLLDIFV